MIFLGVEMQCEFMPWIVDLNKNNMSPYIQRKQQVSEFWICVIFFVVSGWLLGQCFWPMIFQPMVVWLMVFGQWFFGQWFFANGFLY